MKLHNYLSSTDIRIISRRYGILFLVSVFCLCTAMRCKLDDYVYYDLEGLGGKQIHIDLTPDRTSYHVGDLITIEGTITPEDLGLEDFSMLEEPNIPNFVLQELSNPENIDYEALTLEDVKAAFDENKTVYTLKYEYQLKKKGRARLMTIPAYTSKGVYSLFYVRVLSGKRKPRGYEGYVPLIFTNSGQSYIDIEVEE